MVGVGDGFPTRLLETLALRRSLNIALPIRHNRLRRLTPRLSRRRSTPSTGEKVDESSNMMCRWKSRRHFKDNR